MTTTPICVPQAGMNAAEATLVEWLVADGSTVAIGDAIYRLETEKVEMDVDAPVAGVIRHIGEVGVTYDVGALIAEIVSSS